jgi:hypothetical protein
MCPRPRAKAGKLAGQYAFTIVAAAPVSNAPTVTTVEVLGVIPVAQAVNGLGFNVSPGNDWKFKMVAAAGATHARFQRGWDRQRKPDRYLGKIPTRQLTAFGAHRALSIISDPGILPY